MKGDIFQAIADPTRREIIEMLASESLNLNSIANKFEISRPAISKHIKILTESGIVRITQKGRERFCELEIEGLDPVKKWLDQKQKFWENKLDKLELLINNQNKK